MDKKAKVSREEEKREVPGWLRLVLEKDVALTKYLIKSTKDLTLFKSFKAHNQMFEVSCHGILWLSVCLASIWVLAIPAYFQLQINLLFGLILDIIVVALLKALTRRRRPSAPSASDLGPDKFSFPSGHASRATFLACVFILIDPQPMLFFPPILAWVTSICVSRVISERHHILDVVAGIGIGLAEGLFMSLIWFGPETSLYLVSFLTDEKFSGGEYHV